MECLGAWRWECDICENPRFSSQMLRCIDCGLFISYCHGNRTEGKYQINGAGETLHNGICHNCKSRTNVEKEGQVPH